MISFCHDAKITFRNIICIRHTHMHHIDLCINVYKQMFYHAANTKTSKHPRDNGACFKVVNYEL